MFTNLKEIQAYIEEYEQKWLDLDNEELWSKAYLLAERTIKVIMKAIFEHFQIRLVASNEPSVGCGPLPDGLRKKRCIYAVDTFDDNLCVWMSLSCHMQKTCPC